MWPDWYVTSGSAAWETEVYLLTARSLWKAHEAVSKCFCEPLYGNASRRAFEMVEDAADQLRDEFESVMGHAVFRVAHVMGFVEVNGLSVRGLPPSGIDASRLVCEASDDAFELMLMALRSVPLRFGGPAECGQYLIGVRMSGLNAHHVRNGEMGRYMREDARRRAGGQWRSMTAEGRDDEVRIDRGVYAANVLDVVDANPLAFNGDDVRSVLAAIGVTYSDALRWRERYHGGCLT
jgi:hypothetical protein